MKVTTIFKIDEESVMSNVDDWRLMLGTKLKCFWNLLFLCSNMKKNLRDEKVHKNDRMSQNSIHIIMYEYEKIS